MKRSFLSALGLEKSVIDQIMEEHGNTIETVKEKSKEDAEKQAEKLNKTIETLQEKIDNAPKPDENGEDWKSKHDTLKGEFDTYKTNIETEKTTNARRTLAETKLAEAGANPKAIKFLVKEIELDKLKDDGSNWDELHKPIQEANADFYGKTETVGVEIGNPPPAGAPNEKAAIIQAAEQAMGIKTAPQ